MNVFWYGNEDWVDKIDSVSGMKYIRWELVNDKIFSLFLFLWVKFIMFIDLIV